MPPTPVPSRPRFLLLRMADGSPWVVRAAAVVVVRPRRDQKGRVLDGAVVVTRIRSSEGRATTAEVRESVEEIARALGTLDVERFAQAPVVQLMTPDIVRVVHAAGAWFRARQGGRQHIRRPDGHQAPPAVIDKDAVDRELAEAVGALQPATLVAPGPAVGR